MSQSTPPPAGTPLPPDRPDARDIRLWLGDEGILLLPHDGPDDEDLFAAGLDSLAAMQVVVGAGVHFGANLEPGDLTRERIGTPAALAALIRARRSGSPPPAPK